MTILNIALYFTNKHIIITLLNPKTQYKIKTFSTYLKSQFLNISSKSQKIFILSQIISFFLFKETTLIPYKLHLKSLKTNKKTTLLFSIEICKNLT